MIFKKVVLETEHLKFIKLLNYFRNYLMNSQYNQKG